jgi:hypothetical protein
MPGPAGSGKTDWWGNSRMGRVTKIMTPIPEVPDIFWRMPAEAGSLFQPAQGPFRLSA